MKIMLDDLPLGEDFPCGSFTLNRQQIVDFATQFDPQPWHLTDEGAAGSYFQTLCASGLHSQGMAIGLMVRAITDVHVVAGGSLNEARFFMPVRPDQPYSVTARWVSARPSSSNSARGVAVVEMVMHDADGVRVMQCGVTYIVGRCVPGG
jgi:acyl dehydratase